MSGPDCENCGAYFLDCICDNPTYYAMPIKRSGWIDVKEGFPEDGVLVLTYAKSDKTYKIDYVIVYEAFENGYIWGNTLSDEYLKITHWRPLPDPPIDADIGDDHLDP